MFAFSQTEIAQRFILGAMAGAILRSKEPPDIARYHVLEGGRCLAVYEMEGLIWWITRNLHLRVLDSLDGSPHAESYGKLSSRIASLCSGLRRIPRIPFCYEVYSTSASISQLE